ncbi:hypothetical protein KAR91_34430 [Candidatus Pacearchaeota archaeon]|nr:hypothetical protein [Candidatus Pacearchaeota archaeon]
MTPEEKEEIIQACVERCYLGLPELIKNLIAQKTAQNEIKKEFFEKHPDFMDHKESVTSVIEMIDGEFPTIDYRDKLKKAVPRIRKRIETIKSLDTDSTPKKLDRFFHGEL